METLHVGYKLSVPIFLEHPKAKVPTKAHEEDACFDVYSCVDVLVPSCSVRGCLDLVTAYVEAKLRGDEASAQAVLDRLPKAGPYLVDVGFRTAIPPGWEAVLRPRSGLGLRKGIQIHPGTIDAYFTGRWSIGIYNFSDEDLQIRQGDRIAQVAFRPIPDVELVPVKDLSPFVPAGSRGDAGFGSTGR